MCTLNDRPGGELWVNGTISDINGARGEEDETLEYAGITMVRELKAVEYLVVLNVVCPGISVHTLKKWKSLPSCDETCLHTKVDYQAAINTYLVKYGVKEWRQQCENGVFMRKFMCVTGFMTKIHDKTKQAFVGTAYKGKYVFTMIP